MATVIARFIPRGAAVAELRTDLDALAEVATVLATSERHSRFVE